MMTRAVNAALLKLPREGERLPPETRDAVLRLLARLEELARELAPDPHAPGRRVEELRAEFHRLLGPDAPRAVWRFHPGWPALLEACVAEDRARVLSGGPAAAPALSREERRDRVAGLPWRPVISAVPVESGRAARVALSNRLASVASALGRGTAGTLAALEVALDPAFRAALPPGWTLLAVDVEEAGPEHAPAVSEDSCGDAALWEWSRPEPRLSGVVLRLRASTGRAGFAALVAWVWLLPAQQQRGFLAGLFGEPSDGMRTLWTAVAGEDAKRAGGVLADAAATLTEVAGQRPLPPFAEVIADPSRAGLAALAGHREELSRAGKKVKAAVRAALVELVPATPWELTRRHLLDVARTLSSDAAWAQRLLPAAAHCLLVKEVVEPADVRWLLAAADLLRVDLAERRTLIEAILALAPGARLGERARHCLRDTFHSGASLSPDELRGLLALASDAFAQCGAANGAAWMRAAGPLIAIVQHLGAPVAEVSALLAATVVPGLLARCPRPAPGTWQVSADHAAYLEDLGVFGALTAPLAGSGWDAAALAWLDEPLPALLEGDPPCRHPASYWPLLGAWLARSVPGARALEAYREDAAGWALAMFLAGPEASGQGPPEGPGTGSRARALALSRAGAWLRQPPPWTVPGVRTVPPGLVRAVVDSVDREPRAAPGAAAALSALLGCGPDAHTSGARDDEARLTQVMHLLAPLLPRLEGPALRRWLADLLEVPAASALPALVPVVGRSLIAAAARGDGITDHAALLAALPASDAGVSVLVDAFVTELPVARDLPRMAEALERLQKLSPRRSHADRWAAWFERLDRALRADPGLVTSAGPAGSPDAAAALLLRASALGPDVTRLVAALVPRWTGLAAQALAVDGDARDDALFADLVALTREAPGLLEAPAQDVGSNAITRRLLDELALRVAGLAGSAGARRVLRAVTRWARALSGDQGPGPLLSHGWPALPAELIASGNGGRLSELGAALGAHGLAITPAMRIGLSLEVTARLADPPRQNAALMELLGLLAALVPAGRERRLWEAFAATPAPAYLEAGELLDLARDLHYALFTSAPDAFDACVFRHADALRPRDRGFAARLVQALAPAPGEA